MYLILALDGGGVRGALTARLLERLEAACPFLDKVQLVAGTSIGGINALYLADNRSPTQLVDLFKQHGAAIFKSRGLIEEVTALGEVFKAKFTQEGLIDVITTVFGTRTISSLKKRVLVTSFLLDNQATPPAPRIWEPKVFDNFVGPASDGARTIMDVALMTSAAPTYFPSYLGHIDGGVAANNPSMYALTRAVKSGVPLTDIVLLSVGTGLNPTFVAGDTHDYGLEEWAPKLIPMMFDAMVGVPDEQCAQLLGSRYVRLNPVLSSNIDLADASKIDELMKIADQADIQSALKLLGQV
jgi:patatin-like phospholipase/acyl hydrolase